MEVGPTGGFPSAPCPVGAVSEVAVIFIVLLFKVMEVGPTGGFPYAPCSVGAV